jgi:hypothetical protein
MNILPVARPPETPTWAYIARTHIFVFPFIVSWIILIADVAIPKNRIVPLAQILANTCIDNRRVFPQRTLAVIGRTVAVGVFFLIFFLEVEI